MSKYRLPGNPFAMEDSNYEPTISTAFLALAYEQRTANLLALWANPSCAIKDPFTGNDVTWGVTEDRIGKLLEEILQRLGGDQ